MGETRNQGMTKNTRLSGRSEPSPPDGSKRSGGGGAFRAGRSPVFMIIAMCLAEVFTMAGTFSFPSLLPLFLREWNLSNTSAGWINGGYFLGYTLAVPLLAGLTDRVDARRVFLFSSLVNALASLGFAFFAEGLKTALLFRALGGFGLAGAFIPGLKALVDRLSGPAQARAVSFYTASFSLGMSLSFFLTGSLSEGLGWSRTFLVLGVVSLAAPPLAILALEPRKPPAPETSLKVLIDFRPVMRNRKAMSYILAYAAHMWEMFAFRSWMVAFLTFTAASQPESGLRLRPTTVAALAGLVAMWASVGGAELALKRGRALTVTWIMWASGLMGCLIGLAAGLSYPAAALLGIIYTLFLQGDSAALHTGVIQSAEPSRRGATMAFQSLLGFGCASLGPMAVGVLLDLTGGGQTVFSWFFSFLIMGAGGVIGPILLLTLARGGENRAEPPVGKT
ncbi:MAG: MFS transporter [Pseudomonadota bacterium]